MKFFTEKYIVDAQTVLPGLSWRGKRSGDEANCTHHASEILFLHDYCILSLDCDPMPTVWSASEVYNS